MPEYLPILTADGPKNHGTPDHAEALTVGRFAGIRDGLQWLCYSHLPANLQRFSAPLYEAACQLIQEISLDPPELTTAINGLIAVKDAAMRAGIRNDTGRAGSVPRPQEVVDPPLLDNRIGPNFGRPIEDRQPDAVRPRPIKDNPQA